MDSPASQEFSSPASPPAWTASVFAPTPELAAPPLGNSLPRRHPAQRDAVVAVRAGDERLVGEGTVGEVVGVRVVAVEIADVGEEASGAQAEARGKRGGVDVGFLDVDADSAVVLLEAGHDLAVELVVDVRRERELRFAERKALLARAALAHDREPGAHVVVGVERVVRVGAVEDHADRGVERVVGCAAAGSRNGRGGGHRGDRRLPLRRLEGLELRLCRLRRGQGGVRLRPQLLRLGLERLQPLRQLLVALIGGGIGRQGRRKGSREQRDGEGKPGHSRWAGRVEPVTL
jgi:hypothetical protein